VWQMVLFFLCLGMFGVGVGMLYTPILVDRMQLAYPSGFAVANILRALTDRNLLRRSVAKLGGGILTGFGVGWFSLNVPWFSRLGLSQASLGFLQGLNISISTVGAGMIVGARIAIPALVVALIGLWQRPYLVSIGWLAPGAPFRKIGFIIALGTILGAALLDIGLILVQAVRRFREKAAAPVAPPEDWKRVNMFRLILWVIFWGAGIVIIGSQLLHQPVFFLTVAVLLSFLFVLVNGISQGISDWNPVSSAFVLTVFILTALGLRDAGVGLMCASIVLIACSEGGDMQQDRSTGWRLGTNRIIQFRYQVIGIAIGAVLAVALAKIFMHSYDVLRQNQFDNPHIPGAEQWQSAMTYKFVGALKDITNPKPYVMKALRFGILLGLFIEIARKLIRGNRRYQQFVAKTRTGYAADFILDAVLISSPYASSFGGFVELPTVLWWTAGGVGASLFDTVRARLKSRAAQAGDAGVPADMSTMSLVGGGLIAGDSLAALSVGIYGLLKTVL
jgi:hypothetical protein